MELARDAGFDAVDFLFAQRVDWFELLKILRQAFDAPLHDTEAMVLRHDGWRRWCERQIVADPRCRKLARRHIRARGAEALLVVSGDRISCRPPQAES